MSITFPIIITADDYREFQKGKNSPVNDNDINSAINTTFIQLNGICNNQIMLRWNLTEGSDMLNSVQKNLIQQAFLLQTKYNLDYDNDTSEGTVQSSFGANNYSSTRPRRDKITQDVLNLLNKAGVYQQFQATSVNRSRYGMIGSARRIPSFDDFITYEMGDARYVQKTWPLESKNRFLFIDNNGIVIARNIGDIGGGVWGSITGTITAQTDLVDYITTRLSNYYTASECDDKFFLESEGVAIDLRLETVEDNYITKDVNNLTNYYLKTQTYTKTETNDLIASESAHFLGTFIAGTTRPASFDYDTYIKSQVTSTPTNNDFVYVGWSETGEYDRCKYNSTGDIWSYEFTVIGDLTGLTNRVTAIETKDVGYDTHLADTTIHVTPTDKAIWNAKQDDLTTINGYNPLKKQTLIQNLGAFKWVTVGSYFITTTVTNGTYSGDTEIEQGSTATVTITPNSEYHLPSTVTVTGATHTYNSTTGEITLSNPTDNVVITAACTKDWWDDVSSFTTADIGVEKDVIVNGITHKVRLIGIDHDDKADGSGKAHTTWEFKTLISDTNGYSLATFWKDTNDTSSANFDFINSDIRKALDGQGTGTANWFEKGATTWSTTYANKSVLEMLPANLQSKLVEVKKKVNIKTGGSWAETDYNAKLFLLAAKETGYSTSGMESGVTPYKYYETATTQTEALRIKQQEQGSTGAITSGTSVTSGAYSGTKYSYAGYNSATAGEGGIYWLRSPNTSNTYYAWGVYYTGYVNGGNVVCSGALVVSPCFCL